MALDLRILEPILELVKQHETCNSIRGPQMSAASTKMVSQGTLTLACGVAAVLFLALLICILGQSPGSSGASGVQEKIDQLKPSAVMFVLEGLEVRLLGPDGAAIEPCDRGTGTKISKDCGFDGEVTHDQGIFLAKFQKNPDCVYVRDSAGHLRYTYHISNAGGGTLPPPKRPLRTPQLEGLSGRCSRRAG